MGSIVKITIFQRIIIVQCTLIAVVVLASYYAIFNLDEITRLNTRILTVDSTCVAEEKRLLKIFLGEMRNAEKFLVLHDQDFYSNFLQSSTDFISSVERIGTLVETPEEHKLVDKIETLHSRYKEGIHSATPGIDEGKETRSEISDDLISSTNELIRLREQIIQAKTSDARDQAIYASKMMGWLAFGGISLALLLAYTQARSISRPLNRLAREMRRLAKGEPVRSLAFRAPPEVTELAETFYSMIEELNELERLKADFTAHVSHELRTPLTAIREGTALLLEEIPGPLNPEQMEILEVMRNHSGRLHSTISSILDLSKMEAEMMEYEQTACDVYTLIHRSLENVRLIAEKRRVTLHTHLSESLPIVFVDERRIQQVMENLFSNALKFVPEGGEIRVTAGVTEPGNKNGSFVEIRVSDNGRGIPEQDIDKIFTKFFQSPKHRTQKLRGTGLGLAICRHIIHAHKGRIWAESRFGEGSTFVFTLPAGCSRKTSGDRV